MKTRVITAVVGLAFLALVLTFFDTLLFDLTLTAVCLLAIHEVFSAMGFGSENLRLPLVPMQEENRQRMMNHLRQLGVNV